MLLPVLSLLSELRYGEKGRVLMVRPLIEEQVVQEASVTVRWCITPDEQKMIADLPPNRHVLVLVIGVHMQSRREVRHLVPIGEVFKRMIFPKPGTWRILVGVLAAYDDQGREHESAGAYLKTKFLREDSFRHSKYQEEIFSPYRDGGSLRCWSSDEFVIPPEQTIEVGVPTELFSSEPPQWERRWVTSILNTPLRDQCDYRKRRVFAYTVQPILYGLLGMIALSLGLLARLGGTIILAASGFWSLDWKYVLHPFSYPKWIWHDKINKFENVYVSLWENRQRKKISLAEKSRREQEETRRKEELRTLVSQQRMAATQLLLSCDKSLNELALPIRARVRLLFADLKSKVCRPYAS